MAKKSRRQKARRAALTRKATAAKPHPSGAASPRRGRRATVQDILALAPQAMTPEVQDKSIALVMRLQAEAIRYPPVEVQIARVAAEMFPPDLGERLARAEIEENLAREDLERQLRAERRPAPPRSAAELLPELRQQFPASNPKHSREFLRGELRKRGVHVDKSTVTKTLKRLGLK